MLKQNFLLCTLLLLINIPAVRAQKQVINDTSSVEVRQPPAAQINQYAQRKAFNYGTSKPKQQSLWYRIQTWIWKQIEKLLQTKASRILLKIAFYGLFIALVILIIKQFIYDGVFRSETQPLPDFNVQQHSDEPRNLEPMINRAIKKKQYNLAVRLLFKKSLLRLQQNGWINWQKRKTNHDYIYEINQAELRQIFRSVTHYYEYAEYGNFSLDEALFQKVLQQFKQMDTILNSSS